MTISNDFDGMRSKGAALLLGVGEAPGLRMYGHAVNKLREQVYGDFLGLVRPYHCFISIPGLSVMQ